MLFANESSVRAASLRLSKLSWTLSLVSALALSGCDDDEKADDGHEHEHADAGAPGETPDSGAAQRPGVYAFLRSVEDAEFASLTSSFGLKADAPELARDKAREIGGNLLAASGNLLEVDESSIHQWRADDKLELVKGPTVNFSEFPLAEGANDFFQFQVDDHHRLLPFDIVNRVVWDPIDMKIVKVVEGDSKIPLESDGLKAKPAGNRSKIHYPGTTKMPVFYLDEEYVHFAPHTALGVYDPKTFEEIEVIDLPCPGLAVATQDEEGYTYYGTWDYSPLLALYNKGPKPCLARLTPDDKLDEAWTTDLTDLTGGRYGTNFNYVRDGWGLMDVLHHDQLDLDFGAAEIPEDALEKLWEPSNWSIWLIDLKNKRARPLEELGEDIHLSFWSLTRIDGRVFINLQNEEEVSKLYELDETGTPTLYDQSQGSSISWLKVR